jgi:hypothetical protein
MKVHSLARVGVDCFRYSLFEKRDEDEDGGGDETRV